MWSTSESISPLLCYLLSTNIHYKILSIRAATSLIISVSSIVTFPQSTAVYDDLYLITNDLFLRFRAQNQQNYMAFESFNERLHLQSRKHVPTLTTSVNNLFRPRSPTVLEAIFSDLDLIFIDEQLTCLFRNE